MRGSDSVFGFVVTYVGQGDEFTTHQVHRPVDGRYFTAKVVKPVVLEGIPGWKIDASDPYIPTVIGPSGQRLPLNKAVEAGVVVASEKWERDVREVPSQATVA